MKITRAMELIATSRILKAQQRVEQARPYAERLTAAIDAGRDHRSVEKLTAVNSRRPA